MSSVWGLHPRCPTGGAGPQEPCAVSLGESSMPELSARLDSLQQQAETRLLEQVRMTYV